MFNFIELQPGVLGKTIPYPPPVFCVFYIMTDSAFEFRVDAGLLLESASYLWQFLRLATADLKNVDLFLKHLSLFTFSVQFLEFLCEFTLLRKSF